MGPGAQTTTVVKPSDNTINKEELLQNVVKVLREPLKELTATLPSFFPLREDRIILLPPHRKLPRSVKDVVMRCVVCLFFWNSNHVSLC